MDRHFQKHNQNNLPTQAQIDHWISQLTDYDFSIMRSEAAEFFENAARDYLQGYIEEQKKAAVDNSILGEVRSTMTSVKSFTSAWKHLGIALLMAIVAPVLLGAILFFTGLFDKSFPVHVTITPVESPAGGSKSAN